jgi:hypothetical protein
MKRPIIAFILAWTCGFMCACMLLGCGGEIDPAGAVRVDGASGTWTIGRRGM